MSMPKSRRSRKAARTNRAALIALNDERGRKPRHRCMACNDKGATAGVFGTLCDECRSGEVAHALSDTY